jgi:Fe-S cluster assembly protein SufB
MRELEDLKESIERKTAEAVRADYDLVLPGLTEEVVREISRIKNEPEWMLNLRLKSLEIFQKSSDPRFGPSLEEIDYDAVVAYAKPGVKK